MFDSSKDFYIAKAYRLLSNYEEQRDFAKASLISELIWYQKFFGPISILDTQLLINSQHQKETVKSVISDLGYFLTLFDDDLSSKKVDRFSIIAFTVARSK